MRGNRWRAVLAALALAGTLPAAGCIAAAAAAGAAGGVYVTTRGAESTMQGSLDDVTAATTATFGELGITSTGNSTEGDERTWKGTKGELEITVEAERESDTQTKVEVTARRSTVEWDKDYARQVLSKIVEKI